MKNHYTLNPGEFFVAQELSERRPELVVHFPMVDRGYDLLVTKPDGESPVRIQVKESRVYHHKAEAPESATSWHQLRECKLKDADVFVFVYYPILAKDNKFRFDRDDLVIPRRDLMRLCANKKTSKGKYSFYFRKGVKGLGPVANPVLGLG